MRSQAQSSAGLSSAEMAERLSPTLRAVSDAVLAVAAELSVDEVLQRLVDSARELAGARYAALGMPDGEGGFRRFLTSGMSDELIASLGPLPRQHGMLGAMLETAEPYRTSDIHEHPRFRGWWPTDAPGHALLPRRPDRRAGGRDRRLLPDREGRRPRTSRDEDEELIELLAAHAAIAIANARLYEQTPRALDRRRAQPARARPPRRRQPEAVRPRADRRGGGDAARARPGGGGRAGREAAGAGAGGARGAALADLRAAPARPRARRALRRAAQARRGAAPRSGTRRSSSCWPESCPRTRRATARSSGSPRRRCRTRSGTRTREPSSCGSAPTTAGCCSRSRTTASASTPRRPELRSRRLGLTSMEERAQRLGGTLEIRSAPGAGTTVRLRAGDG